ncbi:S8 family serine peptidase [Myroides odoratimimus]|uniref:S8 family serine peptidase n=1 Tax=Myroides odoratimimus TaxID=76832 RepID=UPI0025751548|nr:S8 family serine peptidase [Myroides odoratimimus]MDM1499541.1 S8 family peptidase [Myroides odoratimimus]
MKKTVLTGFVLLGLGVYSNYGQTVSTRNAVKATYDLSKANNEIKAYITRAESNKRKAYSVAEKNNLPTSGVNARGNYFELSEIDENGILLYKTTLNAGSRITAKVEELPSGTGKFRFLEGDDMLVGVVDGLPLLGKHQEFSTAKSTGSSRVRLMEDVPEIPLSYRQRREHERSRSHATHVAGTIASGGFFQQGSKGIAPKAKLWSYSWTNDIVKMTNMATQGILVSNHSYGYNFFDDDGFLENPRYIDYFGSYMTASKDFDRLTVLYPYYQPVVAAGNDGEYHYNVYKGTLKEDCNCDLLTGTSVAKNAVVVAAIEDVPYYVDASSVSLASFSTPGPTNDFRIKPDISAKGVDVLSTVYKNPNANGVEPQTNLYGLSSGTSMAAPAVTGVFTLWQQWAILHSMDKRPFQSATIRGLMAHTADEAGRAPGPDHLFGWGLINAKAGVDVMLAAKDNRSASIVEGTLVEGQQFTKEIVVTKEMSKLVVTLSWTDPESWVTKGSMDENVMEYAPLLVNDLNVVVKSGKDNYYPWKLNKSFKNLEAVRGINDVDNIEKVELYDVKPGKYVIEVSHSKKLREGKQAYSLITTVGEFDNLEQMEEEAQGREIRLWPNPVVDKLYVSLGDQYNGQGVQSRVFDINGRLIMDTSEEVKQGQVSVNMMDLNANVYVVEVKTKDSSKTVRIAKR